MRSRFIDFLTGYEKSEKTFEGSRLMQAQLRFTDSVVGGSSSLATLLIKNPVSRFLSNATHTVVAASTRAYGVLFLTFGIVTLLLNIFNYYFSLVAANTAFDIAVGTILLTIAIPLMLLDIPFADIFQKLSFTNVLIFDVLCIKHFREGGKRPKDSITLPVVLGALLATLGFFIPMQYLLLGAAVLIYVALALASPEFSFMTTVLLIPIYPIMPRSTLILTLLIALTFLSFVFKVVLGKRIYHFEQYDMIILAFMIFVLISGIFNKGFESFESSLITVALGFMYFLTSNLIVNRRLANNAANIIVFASIPEAIYAIITYFLAEPHAEWTDPAFEGVFASRAVGTFGNPNIYAVYLLITVILSVAFMLSKVNASERVYYGFAAILNTGALVMTWTRGAWIALIISAAAALIVKSIKAPKLLLIPLVLLPMIPFVIPQSIRERLLSAVNLSDSSIQSRLSIWRSSLAMLKERLFIGVGIGESAFRDEFAKYAEDGVTAPHSHNLFLEIACEAGIFALLAFVLLLLIRLRHRATYARYADVSATGAVSAASAVALTALLVFGMTDHIWYSSVTCALFWVIFGMGSALLRISRKSYEEEAMTFIAEESSNLSADADIRISKS